MNGLKATCRYCHGRGSIAHPNGTVTWCPALYCIAREQVRAGMPVKMDDPPQYA